MMFMPHVFFFSNDFLCIFHLLKTYLIPDVDLPKRFRKSKKICLILSNGSVVEKCVYK